MKKQEIFVLLKKEKTRLESLGYNVWGIFLKGSQNYNLDIYTEEYKSDFDFMAFVIPSFNELYSGKAESTLQFRENGTTEIKDIRHLHTLIKKANLTAFELLFTEYKIVKSHSFLFGLAEHLLKERFMLFIDSIPKIINNKQKTLFKTTEKRAHLIEKYGYDPKELHHIVRLRYMLEELAKGKSFTESIWYNEGVTRDILISIKNPSSPIDKMTVNSISTAATVVADEMVQKINKADFPLKDDACNELYDIIKGIIKSNMIIETKAKSSEAYQYHNVFSQYSKEHRDFMESLNLGITKEHFVDLLEYRDYEVVNFWPIKYNPCVKDASLDEQEFESAKDNDKLTSELLSALD